MIFRNRSSGLRMNIPLSVFELQSYLKSSRPLVLEYFDKYIIVKVKKITLTATMVELELRIIRRHRKLESWSLILPKKLLVLRCKDQSGT